MAFGGNGMAKSIAPPTSARASLQTPALIVELDGLDRNIATMAAHAKAMGVALRPHVKSHKCVEIAQRLSQAGVIGTSCATINEAEAMAQGGLEGILLTSPIVTPRDLDCLRRLLLRGAEISVVADHPQSIDAFSAVAEASGRSLQVLVDIDVGMGRTGCAATRDIVALAKLASARPFLRYRGVQAYWGNLQQVMPFAERARLVGIQIERIRAVLAALRAEGVGPEIVTGGGTGTHAIDGASGVFTELQPGSFLFMDSCYGSIMTSETDNPFVASLFVAASVVSANHPGRVTVNAGWKAFATDSGKPQPSRGAPAGATYRFMGDEHGIVEFGEGQAPALSATIEFLTPHCDPTVNLYSAYYVVRGDDVVDLWPIRARY